LNRAFVIGNGISRKSISLESLRTHGKIYGCNALYRDFDPDYLIAVDIKMVLELAEARYQHKIPVWTNSNKTFLKIPGLNFFNPAKGWSSGPTALWMASEHDNEEIYILGFDYAGIGDDKQQVNNIYSGSFNYKRVDERATYYGNWLKQTTSTIHQFNKKRYIRVVEEDTLIPRELQSLTNLQHMTVVEFNKKFNENTVAIQNESF
jgi:hypothetical protein